MNVTRLFQMALLQATPSHAAALAAIHASAFPPGEQWTAAAFAAQLALPGVFALLDSGGALLLARVAVDEAEVLTLAVAPPARRAGRARALLREAERCAAARGARRLYLEVSATNAPAQALYAAAGYHEVGRRPRYYPDGSDAWILAKRL